jgi:two-component system OmpR family sensor kinase
MKWWRRRAPWTLRRRLVVSVVALFALLSIVVGGSSVLYLRGNLVDRINSQLVRIAAVALHPRIDPTNPTASTDLLSAPGLNAGSIVVVMKGSSIAGVLKPSFGNVRKALTPVQASSVQSITGPAPTKVAIRGLGDFQVVRVDISAVYANVDYAYFGLPLDDVDSTIATFAGVLGGVSLAGLLLIAFATWFIVSYALRPLRRVAATATEVASMPLDRGEVDLSARVPVADTDQRTEVGQVGAALNSMLGNIDEALRARQASESRVRRFVADASHELRTPLASIRGYAELTRRGNHRLPKDVTHSLGRVESEAVRMTSLVEDLLLLARLDAGRDLQTAPVDLSRLLVDCVSDAHAAGPDHEWQLDVPDEPVLVEVDGQRIHQVLANLLANARVHTPAGTHVTVSLAKGESGHAIVTIVDDGPGIPAELQADLFERFARGDASRSRASGSTGLGLAIVRAVVDAHGGTVAVSSTPGNTEFRLELPGAV